VSKGRKLRVDGTKDQLLWTARIDFANSALDSQRSSQPSCSQRADRDSAPDEAWRPWGNKPLKRARPCRSKTLEEDSNPHHSHAFACLLVHMVSPVRAVDATLSHSACVLLACRPWMLIPDFALLGARRLPSWPSSDYRFPLAIFLWTSCAGRSFRMQHIRDATRKLIPLPTGQALVPLSLSDSHPIPSHHSLFWGPVEGTRHHA
jgi:hypothetical protein